MSFIAYGNKSITFSATSTVIPVIGSARTMCSAPRQAAKIDIADVAALIGLIGKQ